LDRELGSYCVTLWHVRFSFKKMKKTRGKGKKKSVEKRWDFRN